MITSNPLSLNMNQEGFVKQVPDFDQEKILPSLKDSDVQVCEYFDTV